MTPARMCATLDVLGLSLRQLADVLDVDSGTVRGWASGRNPIPPRIAIWLDQLAHFLTTHPPPRRPEPGSTRP